MHRSVAVVPGPLTVDLAAYIAEVPVWKAASSLGNLAHRSMLNTLGPRVTGAPSQFSQLATLRAHGISTADPQERLDFVRRRNAWVTELMASAPRLGRPENLSWFSRIDNDLAAVRATLQHTLVDEPTPTGPSAAARIGMYCFVRGLFTEWERWTRLGAQASSVDAFEGLLLRCMHGTAAALVNGRSGYDTLFDHHRRLPPRPNT